jgi:integrase
VENDHTEHVTKSETCEAALDTDGGDGTVAADVANGVAADVAVDGAEDAGNVHVPNADSRTPARIIVGSVTHISTPRDDDAALASRHHRNADHEVSPEAAARMRRGVAANTTRAYTRHWSQFTAWCDTGVIDGVTDTDVTKSGPGSGGWRPRTPMPATAETLLEYVSHLIDAQRSPATIEQAIAAIRTSHRAAGHKDSPDTQAARLALRGYRRDRAAAGNRPRKSPPVTIDVLRQLLDTCDTATLAGQRDRVLLVLGYVLFSRRSELAALRIEDIEPTDGGLYVLIRASKTDKNADGIRVPVKPGQHPDTDPVRIVHTWLDTLAREGITTGPLLRAVTRHDTLRAPSATTGLGLTGEAINERLRTLAQRAGLRNADLLTAHGLRSGPATTAAKRGTPVSAIADQGRWSAASPVVYGYIREADRWNQYPDIGL